MARLEMQTTLACAELDTAERSTARGRVGGALGLASAALLYAAFKWAHHLNLEAVSIVFAWSLTTVLALSISAWSLRTRRAARRFAKLGICLAAVSLLALAFAGLALAAGMNMAGGCGGG
jgi:hypothetical protein